MAPISPACLTERGWPRAAHRQVSQHQQQLPRRQTLVPAMQKPSLPGQVTLEGHSRKCSRSALPMDGMVKTLTLMMQSLGNNGPH